MSTSNVRELAALHQREKKLRQQVAWASLARRAELARQLEDVERKITEMEEKL